MPASRTKGRRRTPGPRNALHQDAERCVGSKATAALAQVDDRVRPLAIVAVQARHLVLELLERRGARIQIDEPELDVGGRVDHFRQTGNSGGMALEA